MRTRAARKLFLKILLLVPILAFLLATSSFGANSLSISDRAIHGTVPGYITEAVAVVEPLGSFAELDLYLTYSDKGKGADPQLEIRHMFELPAGTSAKDLWLWIGDSVMQAKILKTADAHAIYDKITLARRDPALLTVKQGQYDLHVYPLAPGGFRKVKMSFIIPMEENLGVYSLPIPLPLLKASAASKKPLKILFRSRKKAWRVPYLPQSPDTPFLKVLDSAGTAFHQALLGDISSFGSLAIEFTAPWNEGSLVSSRASRDSLLVQVGIDPDSLFGLNSAARPPRKLSVGFDWSGPFKDDEDSVLPQVANLLRKVSLPGDSIRISVSSDTLVEDISKSKWTAASAEGIGGLMQSLAEGAVAAEKRSPKIPTILFCDAWAAQTWNYSGLDKVAHVIVRDHINYCLEDFPKADIIAAYNHGFQNEFTEAQAGLAIKALDGFFARGGTFLTFIAWNRANEQLAKAYLKGLQYPQEGFFATQLVRVPGTEIGQALPQTFYHQSTYPILHEDGDAVSQLLDSKGRPVVVSKRIGTGRIVVSGLWSFRDGAGEIKITSSPLLGMHTFGAAGALPALLNSMRNSTPGNGPTHYLLLSNSAGLTADPASAPWIAGFPKANAASAAPVIALNLTTDKDYQPYRQTGRDGEYYGRGAALQALAASTHGAYYDAAKTPWNQILEQLGPQKTTQLDSVSAEAKTGDDDGFSGLREIFRFRRDGFGSRFFLGYLPMADRIDFRIKAKVHGETEFRSKEFSRQPDPIPAQFSDAMVALFGSETIRSLRARNPSDSGSILRVSVAYRVLTEFTSFLALEPDDTTHFLPNPADEGKIGEPTALHGKAKMSDSLSWKSRIDLGTGGIVLDLKIPEDGKLDAAIFDANGKLVHGWKKDRVSGGSLSLTWSPAGGGIQIRKGTKLFCLVRFTPLGKSGAPRIKSGMIAF